MAIHSVRRSRTGTLAVAAAVVLLAAGCSRVPGVYVYVPASEATATGAAGGGTFDAKAYVEGIWQSKVLPTVDEKAVDAVTLLPALADDQEAASTEYGSQAGTGSPYAFLVKGTGTVKSLDEDSPSHPLTIEVDGLSGDAAEVQVVTGPVIAGTALRDAVGFVKFSDFTNQLDYADAGTELNNRVKAEVLADVDGESLVGEKVEFAGAFSLVAPGVVLVVPTRLAATP